MLAGVNRLRCGTNKPLSMGHCGQGEIAFNYKQTYVHNLQVRLIHIMFKICLLEKRNCSIHCNTTWLWWFFWWHDERKNDWILSPVENGTLYKGVIIYYISHSYILVHWLVEGVLSDSNNIIWWHESEDINKKCLFPKFQLIPILHFQVTHDYVCFMALIDYCVK